jgi:hypothetical protein
MAQPASVEAKMGVNFRGPDRDDIVRDVRIETEWAHRSQSNCGAGPSARLVVLRRP